MTWDATALETLIEFCYTSYIVVEESNVQTLLPAACLLQLAEIQEVCCEFLKRQLDPSNCLGIRALADTHACRDLLRIAGLANNANLFCLHTYCRKMIDLPLEAQTSKRANLEPFIGEFLSCVLSSNSFISRSQALEGLDGFLKLT